MRDRAVEHDGLVLVAEDDGRLGAFASGEVYRRDHDERFEVVDYVNGEVSDTSVPQDAAPCTSRSSRRTAPHVASTEPSGTRSATSS